MWSYVQRPSALGQSKDYPDQVWIFANTITSSTNESTVPSASRDPSQIVKRGTIRKGKSMQMWLNIELVYLPWLSTISTALLEQ